MKEDIKVIKLLKEHIKLNNKLHRHIFIKRNFLNNIIYVYKKKNKQNLGKNELNTT